MDRARLDGAIKQIRDYTDKHPALGHAHHFLYDVPLDKSDVKPEIVVMGINPGENERDRKAYPGPTEETCKHDFHTTSTVGRSQGSKNWYKNAKFLANGKPVVFTELFFWSSSNQDEFKQRYGGPWWKSEHIDFCVQMNRVLISEYRPQYVLFVGVKDSKKVAKIFELFPVYSLKVGPTRLLEHYRDELRPWFFTKHWSGAFGFSNSQKEEIKNYIHRATSTAARLDCLAVP
jgi:hypothetical protein